MDSKRLQTKCYVILLKAAQWRFQHLSTALIKGLGSFPPSDSKGGEMSPGRKATVLCRPVSDI